jgi:hypothetical protein
MACRRVDLPDTGLRPGCRSIIYDTIQTNLKIETKTETYRLFTGSVFFFLAFVVRSIPLRCAALPFYVCPFQIPLAQAELKRCPLSSVDANCIANFFLFTMPRSR